MLGIEAARFTSNADRGENFARGITNWCRDTSPVQFMFVVIRGITAVSDLREFLQQSLRISNRILGKGTQSESDNAVDNRLGLKRQSGFAHAGTVAGCRFHLHDG